MDPDEIRASLSTALPMRPPKWDTEDDLPLPRPAKVEQLENYLLESAYMRAELEEALFWTNALIKQFTSQIEEMTGYEVALPPKARDRITQADINRAKRTVNPAPFQLGSEMKEARDALLRQIDRFIFEEQWVISRAYTLISGG
jgi:hypothetical protein